MKNLSYLNTHRTTHPFAADEYNGMFMIPYFHHNEYLQVIASNGDGWDHVSVSLPNRYPNWSEMTYVKCLFFEPDECVFQLHAPKKDHINRHPFCLYLWRPQQIEIPMPPAYMV